MGVVHHRMEEIKQAFGDGVRYAGESDSEKDSHSRGAAENEPEYPSYSPIYGTRRSNMW